MKSQKLNAILIPNNNRLLGGLMIIIIIMEYSLTVASGASSSYAEALSKSIMFYEGQRSGKLPSSQRVTWRSDSALNDGSDIRMDLVGGYYDAGDNVKFHFPMAFTITMLSWSVIEFGELMGSELQNALEAIRWGSDYLLKATDQVPKIIVAQVGDPYGDHDCWERPEDMDTPRTSYFITPQKPGSELSAEISAALAASSLAFANSHPRYSYQLLHRAGQVFQFADKFRGSYNDSVGNASCPFYCNFGGYTDELIWGASWLHKAYKTAYFMNYVKKNIHNMVGSIYEFGWDTKNAGINVLFSQLVMTDPSSSDPFVPNADNFVCSIMPESPIKSVTYSPGGLMFKQRGSNLQHATSISFLLLVYARYLQAANRVVHCGTFDVTPTILIKISKSQVDYILGKNPLGMSYMVGYGEKFPQKVHHRGSTLPSISVYPQHMQCRDGDKYFKSYKPNINLLLGAIVGGPAPDDSFEDSRYDVAQSEPTTYMNAPFVGVLAYFNSLSSSSLT